MAKITGSRNRYTRRRTKNPTSSTNRPARSRASSNSSRVTSSGGGTKGSARVTRGRGGNRGNLRAFGAAALAGALSTGSLRHPVSKAKKQEASKSINKYNTRDADGTVRSRLKVGPKLVGPKKVGTEAQNFDKAFAAARKAGKSTFTWKGKKYNTKMK